MGRIGLRCGKNRSGSGFGHVQSEMPLWLTRGEVGDTAGARDLEAREKLGAGIQT